MLAASWTGRRNVIRLIRLGLRGAAVVLMLAATMAVLADSRPAAAARLGSGEDSWVTSWSASPQRAIGRTLAAHGFDHQTVRDMIVTSVGGDLTRLGLTNAYGASPLRIGHVTVAVAEPGAAVLPGTVNPVTYRGRASFQIPAGAQILSDPVALRVWPLQELAVSIYLPGRTGPATVHWDAQQVNWVSVPGDHAADPHGVAFTTPMLSWYYLSGLIVQSPGADGTVVAFGDSITDGVGSTVDADARWPSDLATRLVALGRATLSVADAGIGGNPVTAIRAAPIIAGYRQLIARAHARGLKIFGATLLPFLGAGYYAAAGEATREAVNTWIRTSGAFDGVIDFDAVMRDPADPLRLNPAYDSGDHLHPDDAGYQAMANAIDLDVLLPQSLG